MGDRRLIGVEVAHRHRAGLGVDGGDLVPNPNVDAVGAVLFWRSGNQFVWCLNQPADQIGKAAGGVGGARAALEGHDLKLIGGLHPPRLRGGGHACGVATNDDQSFCHVFFLHFNAGCTRIRP